MKTLNLRYCLLAIIFAFCIFHPARSAGFISIPVNAGSLKDPVPPSGQTLRITQMRMFAALNAEQYGTLRGKKLNFFEKLSFRISQNRMKKMLKKYDYGEVGTLQKISWLIKGLMLGPIAVLLAYIFLHDEEAELIKWTWFGFAGWAVGLAIILLVI